MKDISVGIIGGTGGMGGWFADLLRREGCVVYLAGRKRGMPQEQMATICNVVVVSVPIEVTREVIEYVGPLMRKDSLLMDLTSIKREPLEAMLEYARCEVVGCHPLFGPTIGSLAGQNVILCPGRGTFWFSWLKALLEKNHAHVTVADAQKHDRMMSLIQVLNHLHTIHLGMVLANENVTSAELCDWSTPVFGSKLAWIRKIFLDQPSMYSEILAKNPHLDEICSQYERAWRSMEKTIGLKDPSRIIELIEQAANKLWPEIRERKKEPGVKRL